ncbi:hypothetical protein [Micromonospora ureilytica]|uniref:Tetracycline repressor TetR C-terminal domain-containing protein n=1 Tax=Micromonospora ureilytica TaxID=709868 RepID=A0ABS0JKX2_9ACTN|nr:hypothetical protein [Micromonospora ureilytica]MBG6067712.1 hypothetical protein [Micromonospora ureilytica]
MGDRDWKGVTNQILHGVMFTAQLDDAAAKQMAAAMVERRYFGDGPAVYADAIVQAQQYDGPLTDEIETSHSEQGFRDFLRRLAGELDQRRPWH